MRIGVVIAARNAAPWIGDAVASVREQDYRQWRLAVVDDGSADETPALVPVDSRVCLIRQPPAGVSAARNRGAAALSDAEALLFLDADDWLARDALSRLARLLAATPRAVAAAAPCGFVAEADRPGCRPRRVLRPPGGDILERLLVRNLFANCGHVLLRADAAHAAGLFQPALSFGEDWLLLARLAAAGPFAAAGQREAPALFVRRRASGAYLRQAAHAPAFTPCMEAIFSDPAIAGRLPAARLHALREAAGAERSWAMGRALLALGHEREGRRRLIEALRARPSLRRAALFAATLLRPAAGFGMASSRRPRRYGGARSPA